MQRSFDSMPRASVCGRLRGLLNSCLIAGVAVMLAAALPASAIPSVWTEHNDAGRTGQNLSETVLTPANVNQSSFGSLFHYTLDDEAYGQPLYIPGLTMAVDGAVHNVVFISTVNNSVYAFDADSGTANGGNPLWHVNLTASGARVPNHTDQSNLGACGGGYEDFHGNLGTVGASVIDTSTNTLYVATKDVNGSTWTQRLHALDCTSGAEKFGGPIVVSGSYAGTTFSPSLNNQRPALTLVNGIVYVAFSSYCDNGAYHGYILGYNKSTLAQTAVWADTNSNGSQAGIWMGGQGITADSSNNLYVMTGNGTWDGSGNFGESFVKLSSSLTESDYFTPSTWSTLNGGDYDLGSAGCLQIPGTNYIFGGGKMGITYLLNTASLGHEGSTDNVVQEFQATFPQNGDTGHIHGGPVYFNNGSSQYVYLWGENDFCRQYQFNGSSFNTTAVSTSTMRAPTSGVGMPGGFLSVSANGTSNGIVWANTSYNGDANQDTVPGILHAFNASNLSELWNSEQNATRDSYGNFSKDTYPTIANGKVYVGTFGTADSLSGSLYVYGLLSTGSCSSVPAAPGTPTASNTTSTGTSLSWSAVTPPTNCSISGYEIYENGNALANTTSTSYAVTGLSASTTYKFTVAAVDSFGTGAQSASVSVTTLAASSCYAAWVSTTAYSGGATVSYSNVNYTAAFWSQGSNPSTNNGPSGSGEPWVSDGSCGTTTGSTTGSCSATPSAPATPTASGTTTTTTNLAWTAVTPPANCTITSYEVYKNGTALASTTSTSYAVTGLTAGTAYTFTVAAVDSDGTGAQSSAVNVTTSSASCSSAPSAPSTPTASGTTSTSTNLSWGAVTPPANCTISSYEVYKNGTALASTSSTSYAVTGLSPSTTYTFSVAAVDGDGTGTKSSTVSVTTSAASCSATPSAPATPTASGTTSTGTNLSWSAVTPPTNCTITGYEVYKNGTALANTTSTSYAVTGLTASTAYTFTVAAIDSDGTGSQSSGVNVTTLSGGACSGIAAWSGNSVAYSVGNLVTYGGSEYKCIQAHTSQAGWDPPAVPALWSLVGSC